MLLFMLLEGFLVLYRLNFQNSGLGYKTCIRQFEQNDTNSRN